MPEPSAKSLFFQEALSEPQQKSLDQIQEIQQLLDEGHYSEDTFLAKGGMKTVSLSEDKICKRKLAIARPREDRRSEENLRLFLNEARITAELEHPNIVPVHEIALDDEGIPYYTMKYIEGMSLEQILNELQKEIPKFKKEWPLERLLDIFIKVCDAISFAHSKNIIHLDLKPDNIMVSPYGQVQVCDWGIADYADQAEDHLEGRMSGTPGYLSPEQIKSRDLGPHSDIFTLGAMLFKILTYSAPFKGASLEQVLNLTLSGKIPPAKVIRPNIKIPLTLEMIAAYCMNIEIEKRYSSVEEIIHDVNNFKNHLPTIAENPGLGARFVLFVKRNRTSALLALAAITIISIIMSFFTFKVKEEKLKREFVADKAYLHYTELAKKNLNDFNFDQAMHNITLSLSYRDSEEANWIMAQLHMINRDLEKAVIYGRKTQLDYERFEIIYNEFKGRKDTQSDTFMLDLISALKKQHYPGMAMSLIYKKNLQRESLKSHLPLLKKIIAKANPAIEDYSLTVENDRISFESGEGFNRLSPFSGLAIKNIIVNNSYVRSLDPLIKIKSAHRLEFDQTQISNLTPLAGVRIDTLSFSNTAINSVRPLTNCKIRLIRFKGIKVIDLARLKEVEGLEEIHLSEELYNAPHDKRAIKYFKKMGIIKN